MMQRDTTEPRDIGESAIITQDMRVEVRWIDPSLPDLPFLPR